MYRIPSARRARKISPAKLNLIPILDAIFIFIFFLLSSASFIEIFEVNSSTPIVSNKENPDRKPLALTITITSDNISVATGVPSVNRRNISKLENGEYDLESLHSYVYLLKKSNLSEKSVILMPKIDIPYDQLIKIIDSIRELKTTDDPLYQKNKNGTDIKLDGLFTEIIFGNLLS